MAVSIFDNQDKENYTVTFVAFLKEFYNQIDPQKTRKLSKE